MGESVSAENVNHKRRHVKREGSRNGRCDPRGIPFHEAGKVDPEARR